MKATLFDYEIRAKYRKLILTVSSAEAKRIIMKGDDECAPDKCKKKKKEKLAAILKG